MEGSLPLPSRAGDEWIPNNIEPERPIGGLGDADAGTAGDSAVAGAVGGNPEVGLGRAEIFAVVAGAGDVERFAQTRGSGSKCAQHANVLGLERKVQVAVQRHLFDPRDWLKCADENRAGGALTQASHVGAVVHAVSEINIGEAGRTEHHAIAVGGAAKGVRGG